MVNLNEAADLGVEILDLQDGRNGLEVMVKTGEGIMNVRISGEVYDIPHNNSIKHYTAKRTPDAIKVTCAHGCYEALLAFN